MIGEQSVDLHYFFQFFCLYVCHDKSQVDEPKAFRDQHIQFYQINPNSVCNYSFKNNFDLFKLVQNISNLSL
jgi:hypothetical protein